MNTIFKYSLPTVPTERLELQLPEGAKILAVGLDPAKYFTMWAMVDDSKPLKARTFHIIYTGGVVPDYGDLVHLGSVVTGPFVLHVFEGIRKEL